MDHKLEICTGNKVKTFIANVQHLEKSVVAVILRETHNDVAPYLQFVEQYVSPVLTTDVQGRIIHQNFAATTLLSSGHHNLIGRNIFSLLESKYSDEFKLLFAKRLRVLLLVCLNVYLKTNCLAMNLFT
ncbi:hypothetical protein ABFY60_27445 [Lysinibacillus pakistanensis]|uniref:hypothetical protein n=1 Tax=Lysinibacillus pakistanensis TaxID=759811 RepID=UPI003D29F42C